jgi:hypothetical protein
VVSIDLIGEAGQRPVHAHGFPGDEHRIVRVAYGGGEVAARSLEGELGVAEIHFRRRTGELEFAAELNRLVDIRPLKARGAAVVGRLYVPADRGVRIGMRLNPVAAHRLDRRSGLPQLRTVERGQVLQCGQRIRLAVRTWLGDRLGGKLRQLRIDLLDERVGHFLRTRQQGDFRAGYLGRNLRCFLALTLLVTGRLHVSGRLNVHLLHDWDRACRSAADRPRRGRGSSRFVFR